MLVFTVHFSGMILVNISVELAPRKYTMIKKRGSIRIIRDSGDGTQRRTYDHIVVKEDSNDNLKSRTESLKLAADYFLGQIRGLENKVSKEDAEGAKLFFKNAGITLKDIVRQFEDLKTNF